MGSLKPQSKDWKVARDNELYTCEKTAVDYSPTKLIFWYILDPDRRRLERCDVRWHHGVRRPFLFWDDCVLLLHHPLHLRKLYPPPCATLLKLREHELTYIHLFINGVFTESVVLYRTLCSDILLNVFLAIAVDNLADAESLNTDEPKKGWQLISYHVILWQTCPDVYTPTPYRV